MSVIVGVDEVGRGPWAGPLVAAAVIWDSASRAKGLADSKLLSHKQRRVLSDRIKGKAIDCGIGWVSVSEIDKYGLSWANRTAMLRALASLDCEGYEIIVDGKVNYLKPDYNCSVIVKADRSIRAVSAASIVAKVARDSYMQQMAKLYPVYGFEQHVGYGTPAHQASLRQHGLSPLHRLLFKPVHQLAAA